MIRMLGLERLPRSAKRLQAVREELLNFRVLHNVTGRRLTEWVQRNFAARGALLEDFPSGWPPLARATLASRRRRARGSSPLEDSGALRKGMVLQVNARQALLDNPVPYAARHQLGLGVPRRPFFPGAAQARRIVLPPARRYVEEALG